MRNGGMQPLHFSGGVEDLALCQRGGMSSTETFSTKLDLVLKALTMSRGRMAAELGVDKSLVGRWVSGAVTPSSHNLANLTALIARKRDGFTLLDWERDLNGLAAMFGVDPVKLMAASAAEAGADRGGLPGLPAELIGLARRETDRRGGAYEGHYRCTRLAATRRGMFLREHVMIRRSQDVLTMRHVGGGWEVHGWLLSLSGQLYGMLVDSSDDSMWFTLINGVTLPIALSLDGLILTTTLDRTQTPIAMPLLLERLSPLSDDPALDDRRVEEAKATPSLTDPSQIDPDVRDHLFRDFGPTAMAQGGDPFLRIAWDRSRTLGGTLDVDPVA